MNSNKENDVKFYLNEEDDESSWKTVNKTSNINKSAKSKVNIQQQLQNPNELYDGSDDYINAIRDYIQKNNKKTMIIMRGIPGSGKSHLASKICFNGIILSADHYFINQSGVYLFDPRKLTDAHSMTKFKAKESLKEGISPIIIDNTNIHLWEFKPYIKMAYEHEYDVRLVEPNTKWKFNANELTKRNQHNVPFNKIKQMISEYEHTIHLEQILKEFRNESEKVEKMKVNMRKTSGLLYENNKSLKTLLENSNNEWSTLSDSILNYQVKTDEINVIKVAKMFKDTQTTSNLDHSILDRVLKTTPRSINADNSVINLNVKNQNIDKCCDTFDLIDYINDENDDVNLIKQMFPKLKNDDSLIKHYLKQNNYDLNLVASMLSDELCINDDEDIEINRPVYNEPLSLKELCEVYLSRMDNVLKLHYDNQSDVDLDNDTAISVSPSSGEDFYYSCLNDTKNEIEVDDGDKNLVHIKLDRVYIKNLFDLFAESDDTLDNNDSFDIDLDINLAYELYKSWRKTKIKPNKQQKNLNTKLIDYSRTNSTCSEYGGSSSSGSSAYGYNMDSMDDDLIEKKLTQIEMDAQIALEIFEQDNMRHPIDGVPVYFSDYGINSALISLRQIMAEQSAEESNKGCRTTSNVNIAHDPTLAIRMKRRQLYELYLNKIDKQVLDTIYVQNNYNFNETIKFIEKFYQTNEETTIKSNKRSKNKLIPTNLSITHISNRLSGDFTNVSSNSGNNTSTQTNGNANTRLSPNEYRQMANEYFQIRQAYFDKAHEAYTRGWGAVAQYYAELGQKQSIYMKKHNDSASLNIFALNNANINDSNTLDLHGLHVNEAIKMFKQIYTKKRNDLKKNSNPLRKHKTFLYVITGSGRHSVDGVSRLRPKIINYLNQNSIKYQEPNIGLLRVDLV